MLCAVPGRCSMLRACSSALYSSCNGTDHDRSRGHLLNSVCLRGSTWTYINAGIAHAPIFEHQTGIDPDFESGDQPFLAQPSLHVLSINVLNRSHGTHKIHSLTVPILQLMRQPKIMRARALGSPALSSISVHTPKSFQLNTFTDLVVTPRLLQDCILLSYFR